MNKEINIIKASKLIYESKKIVIFSLGITSHQAISFSKRIQAFNKICLVPADRDENVLFANNLSTKDVAIIISASGTTNTLKKVSTIIRSKGVPCISLTGFSQNFISDFSSISLCAYINHNSISGNDIASRIGFNVVLDLIFDEFEKIIRGS